jgi:hypothetical protein
MRGYENYPLKYFKRKWFDWSVDSENVYTIVGR